ncbi:MAG: TIR domain-containing protein, partial [Blastocatellia bacterium]
VRLSPRGQQLARRIEAEAIAYGRVLREIAPYRAALEWARQQRLDVVTHMDVAGYWSRRYPEAVAEHDEKSLESAVVSFFHLCQAADLGTVTMGRRGQPARLRVDGQALDSFLSSNASEPDLEDNEAEAAQANGWQPAAPSLSVVAPAPEKPTSTSRKVFVSHCGMSELAGQAQTALGLADFECEIVERAASTDFMPERTLEALRRCGAAVIIVSETDCAKDGAGGLSLAEGVVTEISAALALYDRRVVLLWESSAPAPAKLRGICRCEFAGTELAWGAGVELVKIVKAFEH